MFDHAKEAAMPMQDSINAAAERNFKVGEKGASPLDRSLSSLNSSVENLHAHLSKLEDKLSPIAAPIGDVVGRASEGNVGMSPVVSIVNTVNDSVEHAVVRVMKLLETVEV